VNLFTGTSEGGIVGTTASTSWLATEPARADPDTGTPVILKLGQMPALSVDYAACALEWQVTVGGVVVERQANPSLDPAEADKAYFPVAIPATFSYGLLQLDLHYASGWAAATWTVTVDPMPIPVAYIVVGSYANPIPVAAGCGFTVQLQGGHPATEACGSPLPASMPKLDVFPQTDLVFRVPQAAFNPASTGGIGCGHVAGTPPLFVEDGHCLVGDGTDSLGDYTVIAPAGHGTYVLVISGCATYRGGQACGSWYLRVNTLATPPQPSASAGAGVGP
jgi:hypothetical protein